MIRFLLGALVAVWAFMGTASAQTLAPVTAADHVLGSDKAPVTVIEYASLSCPHCARWEGEVFPDVQKKLIDTGKIRYVFRDFPLNAPAVYAAQLAHCDEARYFNFLQVLFSTQNMWAAGADPRPELAKLARLGGIGPDQFQRCMADDKLRDMIVANRQAGETAGVTATPFFFFNGAPHSGELSIDAFTQLVTEAHK